MNALPRPRLFEQREARLSALNELPRQHWLGGMVHSQGTLEPRLAALVGLRRGLCAGELPPADDWPWPPAAIATALDAAMRRLDLPRYCAGRQDLAEAVARHAAAIERPVKALRLRDTVSRWGSCTVDGVLSFSWRLILAPGFVLDYVAAHEVAHLIEMNHSPRFWAIVDRLCPDMDRARDWLRLHGPELHAVGANAA